MKRDFPLAAILTLAALSACNNAKDKLAPASQQALDQRRAAQTAVPTPKADKAPEKQQEARQEEKKADEKAFGKVDILVCSSPKSEDKNASTVELTIQMDHRIGEDGKPEMVFEAGGLFTKDETKPREKLADVEVDVKKEEKKTSFQSKDEAHLFMLTVDVELSTSPDCGDDASNAKCKAVAEFGTKDDGVQKLDVLCHTGIPQT
jgi:hypothetical protein